MFKGIEWLYFVLCVIFCVLFFHDGDYIGGIIFTILTVLATINTIRSNLKNKKKGK